MGGATAGCLERKSVLATDGSTGVGQASCLAGGGTGGRLGRKRG
jgi:hypothetical protein